MKNLNWLLLFIILLIPIKSISAKKKAEKSDREIWCDIMYRMAAPVLSNMSEGLLKQNMLVELSPTWDGRNKNVTYMECIGRLMAGLAPWLSLPDDATPEGVRRRHMQRGGRNADAVPVLPQNTQSGSCQRQLQRYQGVPEGVAAGKRLLGQFQRVVR